MDHLEAIVEIKNVISSEFIDKIIFLINRKAKQNLDIQGGMNKDVRNVKGYYLTFEEPENNFYWNFIKKEIERLIVYYTAKFPILNRFRINQIDLLKYDVGGKYELHTDWNDPVGSRLLSIIINLNDDYKGGDLLFTDQKGKEIKRLNLSKGSIVFFPSNFLYPHKIEPITKGTRYSIVSWLG